MSISDYINCFFNAIALPIIALTFFIRIQNDIKIKKHLVFVIAIPICIIVSYLYINEFISRVPLTIVFHGIIICTALFISKDRIINKIVNLIVYYVISMMLDLMSYMIFSNIPSIPYFLSASFFCIVLAMSLLFVEQFIKSFRNKKIDKKGLVFLLIPISQIISFYATGIEVFKLFPRHAELMEYSNTFSGVTSIIICFSILLSFAADIIAFKQYVKSIDTAQIEAENEALEYKNKLNTYYFNELKENETELRKIKHDISGCLETMKEIICTENNIERAQSFFDEMSQTLGNITTGFYCKNSLINAIIISKSKICNSNNISLDVKINIPEIINLSDMDICRALVNMLDNAIEANKKIDREKFINLSIKENDGFIYIHIKNPFNGESIGSTTKTNKKEHGYGLKILSDFAEKYDGYFKTEIENNIVSSLIVMKNERKQFSS